MNKTIAFAGLLMMTVAACEPGPEPGSELTAAEQSLERRDRHQQLRKDLLAADRELAEATEELGIVDGFVRGTAEDLSYLHAGQPIIEGRAATRAFLRATYPDQHRVKLQWKAASGDASQDGRVGYTFGWTKFTSRDPQGHRVTEPGKYISFWRRHGERWRVIAFMRNTSPEPPLPPPAGFPLLSGGRGVPHPGDPDQIREVVRATDVAFAAYSVAQGYSIAFPAYTAEEGVSVSDGEPLIFGREAIGKSAEGWTPDQKLDWAPARAEAAASGDLALTTGNSVFTQDLPDGTVFRFEGKYLTVWTRQPDGRWLYILDGGNPR